ncbi:unnamed protein product [Mytilus coruscus]|uniref:Uncharacterized protein n=1 Tax=Mytilus coruscus TaxID=42192 RepID=A0A6J8EA26_MYTCO|nr:unnamed protein product [Mytilus coruscus]
MSSASDEGSSKRNNDWKFGREQAEKKKDKDAGHRGAGSRRPETLTVQVGGRGPLENSPKAPETSRGRKKGKAPERWSEALLARTSPRSEWTDTQSDLEGDRSPPRRVVMKSVCIPKGPEGTARQAESSPLSSVGTSIPRPALSRRGEDKPSSQVEFQSPKDEEDGFILCPVDGCNVRGINIEPHIRGEHLVEIFQEPSGGLRSNLLVKARFEALQTQSK